MYMCMYMYMHIVSPCVQYCSDSQGSSLHPSLQFLAIVRDSSLTKGSSQQQ